MVCRFEVRFASSFVSVVIDMYIYMDNWNRIYEIKFVYIHMYNCYRLKVKCYWLRNVYYDFI